jgi:hypothetical protein
MKKIYLAILFFVIGATQNSFGQYVFNFGFGPGVSLNKLDPTQIDTFAVSWNDYYKVGLKQGYSLWNSTVTSPGFEITFDGYNPSRLSGHLFVSIGAYWGKQVNQSILWNNFRHELDLRYNDVPVFAGLGLQYKGFIFLDYLVGGNFRTISLTSTVTYPDGSRSMGYEMDILGYYESGSSKGHHGVGFSVKLWRLMFSARWTFPFKSKLLYETHLYDFDVNRYRSSEFPVDFRIWDPTFSNENNMVNTNPLHKSVLNLSVKFLLGKIKN